MFEQPKPFWKFFGATFFEKKVAKKSLTQTN